MLNEPSGNESPRSEVYTLAEILERWPHPTAARHEIVRDLVHIIIPLRTRVAAIDCIGFW